MGNPRHIEIKQLYYFVVVVESGSINKASRILNAVQPGVTSRIKAMEHHLGVQLLHRGAHGIHPTPEGQLFYKRAKRILQELETATAEVAALGRMPAGRIRFALTHSTSQILSVPIAEAVMKSLPDAQFSIVTGTSADNVERLMQEDAELAILAQDSLSPRLNFEPLVEEEQFLVVPANSGHFVGRDSVNAEDVARLPLIMGASKRRSFGPSEIARAFAEVSVDLQVKGEMHSLSAVLDLVLATDSATILPWAGVAKEEEAGLIRRIRVEGIDLKRTLVLAWPADRPTASLMGFVVSAIRSKVAELTKAEVWKHVHLID
ncbi:MAG: LysR family transcriptional regulator [Sphingobium sp.]